jgi:hypothetical protein
LKLLAGEIEKEDLTHRFSDVVRADSAGMAFGRPVPASTRLAVADMTLKFQHCRSNRNHHEKQNDQRH